MSKFVFNLTMLIVEKEHSSGLSSKIDCHNTNISKIEMIKIIFLIDLIICSVIL